MFLLYRILAFVVAITVHEASHAWVADRLGDPTSKLAGRVSLNPVRHLDLYGTVLIPLFLIIIGSPFVFGWAKPVAYDPYNLKDPRRDAAKISLAGPTANLIIAATSAILIRLFYTPFSAISFLTPLLYFLTGTNLVLAIFNLIPIHPLDGGKVLVGLLPPKDALEFDTFMRRWGTLILLFLIFPLIGNQAPINLFLTPILDFLFKILLPQAPLI